jgi:hypothetical protein
MKNHLIVILALVGAACSDAAPIAEVHAETSSPPEPAVEEVVVVQAPAAEPEPEPVEPEPQPEVETVSVGPILRELRETRPQPLGPIEVVDGYLHRTGRMRVRRTSLIWNVPDERGPEPTATALLRICGSETTWSNEEECWALLQTIENVRAQRCEPRSGSWITQCENGEETLLSAMRRMSKRISGVLPPRTRQQRMYQSVTLECNVPEGKTEEQWNRRVYLGGDTRFPRRSMREGCLLIADLARRAIFDGERERPIRGYVPIAWGGRCERTCSDPSDPSTCTARGACDDHIACSRPLHRIPNTDRFANAYWCRRGRGRCPDGPDPICELLGG